MQRPAIVVITHNRREEVLADLARLWGLVEAGEAAEVVVVDNASQDGTADAVARQYPGVRLLRQPRNLGAVGRNVGVRATAAPVVAFADDDSWWAPGALPRAARLFADHERLGLLHARLVVEPDGRTDSTCAGMARGPREPGLPGPSILGHLGCGAVVRREAFLAVGGYSPILGFGGEEALLSLDLDVAGWAQCYVDEVVAHHAPSPSRADWPERWARYRRNDTLVALLRLPGGTAAREAASLLRQAVADPAVRAELAPFLRRLPAVLRSRRRVSDRLWRRWLAFRASTA